MLSLLTPAALACGGLMCDAGPTPVVQNAERIAFLVDEEAGEVEAHVQIFYEGPPDAFAWVVPVAAAPEVFLSSPALFSNLAVSLAPQVQLVRQDEGRCKGEGGGVSLGCAEYSLADAPADFRGDGEGTDDVTVVDQGQVGPYDHVVLQASDEGALITWLQENGYDVPSNLSPLLAPYVVDGGHFVAIRLQKDRDTGDIAPLGFRYRADKPSVPIQLTALATAPDLRLEISVFGQARAVPESYLHVTINEANLDWFNGGQNYYDVVSRAADQAGGHAFATDYAGRTDLLPRLWRPDLETAAAALANATRPAEWASLVNQMGLPADANAAAALGPFGVGVEVGSGALFVDPASLPADLPGLTAAMETFVFEPLRRADALLDQPWVSRLSSSLDAAEMTVDPVFALNPDMGEVDNLHVATLWTECNGRYTRDKAPRRLELSDGRSFKLPAQASVDDDGVFWLEEGTSDLEVVRIEQTGPFGLPEVIADFTQELLDEADPRGEGAGCATTPAGTLALSALLGLGISRRRRS